MLQSRPRHSNPRPHVTSSPVPRLEPTLGAEPSVDDGNEVRRVEGRNLLVLAWYQITLRLSWIFKTESVIIPAFLDAIVTNPALQAPLRGCLPVLNRFGHSVPPLLYADRLKRTPRKSSTLLFTTLLMAVPFLALAASWFLRLHERLPWFPAVFLGLYAMFFAATGLNQLVFGTVQGKLIRPDRRGRLMAISGIIGSILAVTAAWFVMPVLLQENADGRMQGFGSVFLISGCGFVCAAGLLLGIREPVGRGGIERDGTNAFIRASQLVRDDRKFRGLAGVAMLYMTLQLIFPHYQAIGRELGLGQSGDTRVFRLMIWVVVQNAGVGLFSPIVGMIADRAGNRLAVRLVVFASAVAPVLAVALAEGWLPGGGGAFWIVFLLLGFSPIGMRTFSNFVLEFAEEADHPRYISTLKLCMATPFLLSPVVGWLVGPGGIGFVPVFLAVAVCVVVAGLLTFTIHEPRHDGPHVEHLDEDTAGPRLDVD